MPKIISVLNQKGGTTKTTTSTNLAACIAARGHSVLIVDLNSDQGSATDWAAAQDGNDVAWHVPVISMGKQLARDLPRVAGAYEFVIIDGIPQVSELTSAAIKVADLVLIPVQPSQYDIWACGDLVQLVKDRQELADGKPHAALLVARAIWGTRLAREVADALAGLDLPVLEARTHQRVAYVDGVPKGRSVMDLRPNDEARIEIEALTTEVLEILQ
ncbi:ParA family partition ATPase [Pseudomonas aeruginosa]|uniref:ParA family partition ATPase n=1 Tax=Pseudomonas aeruginosa TaxID=287 RepID=UPI00287DC757|nr:ParA family partition ATPase [Pseudomonas aeruginosa]MDS9509446.1 ParA family partition ATPase [Pseudomonas aeruginosa]HCF4706592.1 AAA family ATPase [Pseudomonas aeruginosa]